MFQVVSMVLSGVPCFFSGGVVLFSLMETGDMETEPLQYIGGHAAIDVPGLLHSISRRTAVTLGEPQKALDISPLLSVDVGDLTKTENSRPNALVYLVIC